MSEPKVPIHIDNTKTPVEDLLDQIVMKIFTVYDYTKFKEVFTWRKTDGG